MKNDPVGAARISDNVTFGLNSVTAFGTDNAADIIPTIKVCQTVFRFKGQKPGS